MTNHRITLLEDWYQIVETCDDGSITSIGSFRTEADAQAWLNTYLRMQSGLRVQPGAEVFKVGYSDAPSAAATEVPSASPTEAEVPVTAPEPN